MPLLRSSMRSRSRPELIALRRVQCCPCCWRNCKDRWEATAISLAHTAAIPRFGPRRAHVHRQATRPLDDEALSACGERNPAEKLLCLVQVQPWTR